jgi:chromosome segregation ATPase
MTASPPALKRTLFGYRPEAVRQLLLGRDAMFSRAQEHLREKDEELALARAELQEIRGHLEQATVGAGSTDEENTRLRRELEKALTDLRDREASGGSAAEIEAIRGQLSKQTDAARAAEARAGRLEAEVNSLREQLQRQDDEVLQGAPPSASQELSSVLDMAEQAFGRLMDQARTQHQRQLEEAAGARRELDAQVERFSSWRDHVVAKIRSVREAVGNARVQTQHAPERLRAALAPTTDAMISVNDTLAEFIRVTDSPGPDRSAEVATAPTPQQRTHPQPPTEPPTRPEEGNGEGLPQDFGLQ